ncbi:vitamin b12 abc transporter, atpase component btud [hydrocarbon metagenome]|uniref:Vitamin b12 abc transporter, atpase component btud n=1 Tax=hydrocarbon metagenome TaxID=938273 RepID=A0A0W8FSX3_9ZZZZ
MSVIEARNVNFSYATKPVMENVSFAIDEAQIVAVIGPNGSGKTTLLKIINGTLFPNSGQMIVEGKETGKWSRKEIAQKVAIVPQETSQIFPFYAEEIVLMGRFPHLGRYSFEDKKDYKIVREAMEKTDSLAFADRRFSELSAGERQRVLIARALAQEPKVLLLDESTVFLDLKHQVQFLTLLRQLNSAQKLTVIFVTHDINLAAQNANGIILLDSGKIYVIGNPAEVITAANIKEVYDVDTLVDQNPQNGLPRITLLT